MRISVIVPAYNEEKLLGSSLESIQRSLHAFARIGWQTELIVTDNNSTDRTAEVARQAGAIVVFEPINQIARARNRGAEAATGDWLIFVDADSFPSPELFAAVAKQIRSGRCLGGGCTVQWQDVQSRTLTFLLTASAVALRLMCIAAGSFVFCEAQAFRKIGGFSTEFFAGEEIDFSMRLRSLARRQRKKFVILHGQTFTTSSRKLHLYSVREIAMATATALFTPWRLKNRAKLWFWYDGRR